MSNAPESTVPFGSRDVPASHKDQLVRDVFSSVASHYDLMNDLMSGGVHRLWKDAMVECLNPRPGWHILDVAAGTGDIAFRLSERIRARGVEANILVCDVNIGMIAAGIRRAQQRGEDTLQWILGDAEALPVANASVDAYTIAFGIRNVTHIERALTEARRVLKPGGRFLCLEFSRAEMPGLDVLYERFSFAVLPRLGEWIAKDAEAYKYLVESIRRFPTQAAFAKMIEGAGLARVSVRNMTGGIAALHSAWRI
jgi:ubiquinone/menaquinone biosynthesis methyltransferase